MERHMKGVANHWRIKILFTIAENTGITLDNLARYLKGNFKTISQHTKVLVQSGLVRKKYRGNNVMHSLSPYGEKILKFLQKFSKI